MLDLFMKLSPLFTREDRASCKPVIQKIMFLADTARGQGVLALQKEVRDEPDFFLNMGMSLIVDGTDPELVKEILKTAIISGSREGQRKGELLKKLVSAEGVLMVQKGENPRVMLMKLTAMLGEEYMQEAEEEYYPHRAQVTEYYAFLNSLRGKKALPECYEFERFFAQLGSRDMQLVLRGVRDEEIFGAIGGCSFELIAKVLENLSFNTCLGVIKVWNSFKDNIRHTLSCQQMLKEKIASLQATGEIMIRRGY